MSMRDYSFRPRPLPTLLTLVLLGALVSLGLWQLQRADQKQAIWSLQERNAERAPVSLSAGHVAGDATLLGTPVRVRGRWDGEHQILLVNQTYRGRPGYEVYTPLLLASGAAAVLVDRGWVPHELGRHQPPDPETASGEVALAGVIDKPLSIGLKLGEHPDAGRTGWPRQVQYLDLDWAAEALGYRLLPFVVLHLEGDPSPLTRSRDPALVGKGGMPPARHRSYAVQWFALAATLLVLFIVVNVARADRAAEDRR